MNISSQARRVFPSCLEYSASSRRVQFHWGWSGDS